jgi:hypothetical protein
MPQLQDPVDQQREQLAPLQTPLNPNAPAPSGAAVAGQAVQQSAAVAGDIYLQHKQQMDAAQVAARETVMIQNADTAFNDPDKGFKTTKGLDARSAYPGFVAGLNTSLDQQVASGDNADQRLVLAQHAATLKAQYARAAQEHIVGQEEAFKASAFEERARAGIDQAVNAWSNPQLRESAISQTLGFVSAEALRKGDPDDTAGRAVAFQKKAAEGITQKILSLPDDQFPNKGELAQQFLDAPIVKGGPAAKEVLGGSGARLMEQVSALNQAATAETKAQGLFVKSPDDDGASVFRNDGSGRVDRLALLDRIEREIPPGQFRDQVISRGFRKATEINEGWKDKAQQIATQVADGAINADTGRIDINSAPANLVAQLKQTWPERYESFRKSTAITERIAAHQATREELQQEKKEQEEARVGAWTALNDPTQFTQTVKLNEQQFTGEYRGTMNEKQWEKTLTTFRSAKANVNAPPPDAVLISMARRPLGLGSASSVANLPPAKRQQLMALSDAVTDRLAEDRALLGPKGIVTPEKMKALVAEELTQKPIDGTGLFGSNNFRSTKFQYQLDNEAAGRAAAPPANDPDALRIQRKRGQLRPGERLFKDSTGKFKAYAPNDAINAGDVEVK